MSASKFIWGSVFGILGASGAWSIYDYFATGPVTHDQGKLTEPGIHPELTGQNFFEYREDDKGETKLYVRDAAARDFMETIWLPAARENLGTKPTTATAAMTASPSKFSDWQAKDQNIYLAHMTALQHEMALTCSVTKLDADVRMDSCPPASPYPAKVNALNKEYVASDRLRSWQLQHIELAYEVALMDNQVRQAAHDWAKLSNDEKLAIGRKLLAYQFAAYRDVTGQSKLPIIIAENLLPIEGIFNDKKTAIVRGGYVDESGRSIHLNAEWLAKQSAEEAFKGIWHEGHHIIQGILEKMAATKEGRAYLSENGILADVEILARNNKNFYAKGGSDYAAYAAQAIETGVRVDEAVGRSLGLVAKNTPRDTIFTLPKAQESFRGIMPYTKLDFSEVSLAGLADRDWYDEFWHRVLLKQYSSGGQICAVKPNASDVEAKRQPVRQVEYCTRRGGLDLVPSQ